MYFEFHDRFFLIKDYSGKILHRDTFKDGLYSFSSLPDTFRPHALTAVRASYQLWHNWLGHASFPVLQKSIYAFTLPVANKRLPVCSDCQLARSSQLSFKTSNHKYVHPLYIVHTDVWGPASILSNSGARYYVCFLDDCTKFIWFFPLKLKSDVEKVFLIFKTYVERQFNRTIKNIQSDLGGEYHRMSTLLTQIGIHHRRACPYTYQQMGAVECCHTKLLKSVFHYFLILTFRNSFGKMLFSWPLILSIVFLLLFSIKNIHIKLFIVIQLTIISLEFLVVPTSLIFNYITNTK